LLVLKAVLAPRLLDHRRSSSMLTILVMIALTDVLGLLGLLLAVPVAAVIQITLSELLAPSATTTGGQPATDSLAPYAESIAAVQAQMLTSHGRLSPTQVSMVERLTRLGDDTQLALQGKE
ncbi:MAG TPA: hypothetical protein VGA61_19755, partial [Anaerolineae bacterium]